MIRKGLLPRISQLQLTSTETLPKKDKRTENMRFANFNESELQQKIFLSISWLKEQKKRQTGVFLHLKVRKITHSFVVFVR